MTTDPKIMVAKAREHLSALVSDAEDVHFEEIGISQAFDNPPNTAFVVFSYRDPNAVNGISKLFARKMKGVYMRDDGELVAIKNKLI